MVPRDQRALQGHLGTEQELGQAGRGTFTGGRNSPEVPQGGPEAKRCNTKFCREVEGAVGVGDLRNENPKRPRGVCKKRSLEAKGCQSSPSTSFSKVKRPRRNERKTVQALEMGFPRSRGRWGGQCKDLVQEDKYRGKPVS